MIIWFTGLSGAGKSTLAGGLKEILENLNFSVYVADGDVFRQKKKKENRFSREDIVKNNLEIISHCKKIEHEYDFVIVAVISPFQETRDIARETFGDKYLEIFLDCPLDVLIKKDVKKLYEKAKTGEIKNLIGFSPVSPYERPTNPDVVIKTNEVSISDSMKVILNALKEKYDVQFSK